MSRYVAAVLTLIGPLVRSKVAPGLRGSRGTALDAEALADAVIAGRREQPHGHLLRLQRERREAAEAAARGNAS